MLQLVRMTGTEQLGRLFEYRVACDSNHPEIRAQDIVGQNVTIEVRLPDRDVRYLNGFVSRFTHVHGPGSPTPYLVTVVPWLWLLTRTADCRILQDKTVPEIIEETFRKKGFTDFEDALTGNYRTWEYCVQYRETDFNFVSRLMEQEGIYYYFKQESGRHTLVLADSASAHAPYPGYEQITYHPSPPATITRPCATDWSVETLIQPGAYALNDFDFRNTRKDLQVRAKVSRSHAQAEYEVFDYPGEYVESGEGEDYAKKRIEELQCQYETIAGVSDARGLCPGCTFTLAQHPRGDQNREYLVTSTTFRLEAGEFAPGAQASGSVYTCAFTAMDSSQPFRALRLTPKPTIPGLQTAIVVGPAGEELYTDEYGRVKVQFHWDRYGTADEKSSCWIRVAQVWAGKQWGAMYLPRLGQEVLVEFLEGDPDRPIITGRVYNGQAMPPYDLPAEQTKSTLKSDSSKGGGGSNEIRFEDKKGVEQVYLHAQKNEDIVVEDCKTESVGNNETIQIGNDRTESVGKNETLSVGENRTRQVGQNEAVTIGLNRTHTVAVNEAITVGAAQEVTVGAARTVTVGASQAITVGVNQSENVGKDYTLDVGKTLTVTAGDQILVKTGKASILMKKDGTIVISGKDITLKGSGGINVKASKNVVIKGKKILEN